LNLGFCAKFRICALVANMSRAEPSFRLVRATEADLERVIGAVPSRGLRKIRCIGVEGDLIRFIAIRLSLVRRNNSRLVARGRPLWARVD
jgi:hypothetical protein